MRNNVEKINFNSLIRQYIQIWARYWWKYDVENIQNGSKTRLN